MEGNDFAADQVLAGGKVGGDGEGVLASIVDQVSDSPGLGRGIVSLRSDLGPDRAGAVVCGVGRDVDLDGTQVGGRDNVVATAGRS